MFSLSYTSQFEKDLKLIKKRSVKDLNLCLNFLKNELRYTGVGGLPRKYKAHKLTGNYKEHWECHIKPNLLIIWIEVTDNMEIKLIRIGTHSDLF